MTSHPASVKRMRLRFAGTCHVCAAALPAGEFALYERAHRRVRCATCHLDPSNGSPAVAVSATVREGDVAPAPGGAAASAESIHGPEPIADAGIAGASARRELDRRRQRREERIRERHPKLGGLILALSDEPQSTRAWETGARGEELLAARLRDLRPPTLLLHDRRVPKSRANIDHIIVAPSGVWVVDAKRYKDKRPALRSEGGIIRPRREWLTIGGRDGSRLVAGVERQVELVSEILQGMAPVRGTLCFLEADWPLIGGSFRVSGIDVLWPRLLVKTVEAAPTEQVDVPAVHACLASVLKPA